MGNAEHIGMGVAFWWYKFEASYFQQLTVWVEEVNRIHEAAIDVFSILNYVFLLALCHLCIGCMRDVIRDVMQVADVLRIRGWVIDTRRADKERDQSPIARIEVKMHFIWNIQVGLLEYERHAQHALVEIYDGFSVRT